MTYTCSVTAAVVGTYGATFSFATDSNYLAVGPIASSSTTSVTQGPPTISVVPSTATTTLGSSFTFTATVSPPTGGVMPTGAGTWVITGVSGVSCSSTTGPTTGSNSLTYTCSVTASVAGSYGATFTYQGDSNYSLTSANSSQTTFVAKVNPTVAVTANASTATLGDVLTFTAILSGPANAAVPTGSATWTVTGVTGITACESTTINTTSANTTYTCSVRALKAGTYGVTFSDGGDFTYNAVASTPASSTTTVAQYTPTVLVTSSSPTASLGSTFTFTATVAGPANGPAPTGTVVWSIAGVSGVTCNTSTGPNGVTSSVTYTCSVIATSAGIYLPLFTYNGDSNYLATAPTSGSTTTVSKNDANC